MKAKFISDLRNFSGLQDLLGLQGLSSDLFSTAGADVDAGVSALPFIDGAIPARDVNPEVSQISALSGREEASAATHGGDVAVPEPEGNFLYQTADGAKADHGTETASPIPLPIPVTPMNPMAVPANALSADLAAAPIETHHTGLAINYGDAGEMPGHAGNQMFAGLNSAPFVHSTGSTLGPTVDFAAQSSAAAATAGVANTAHGTSGVIANAGIGSGGATAAQVQQALNESGLSVNGAGIKVGVLSDSFNDLGGAATDEADGALPSASNIQVIKDLGSGGTDEGRAMMQIIHDIAPGASEAFYTAFDSEQDFANGILALAAAGSKVIVDDVSYYDEPFFQNGVVAQAIQTVEAEGVTYVTAAGNEGSNGYQAAWSPTSGSFDGTFYTDAQNFGGSSIQTVTINTEGTGATVPLVLEWDQPYGAATADLQVLVFHNGTLIGEYSNRNSGQELNNPLVIVPFSASGTYQIAIENLSGPNPDVIKEITEGDGLPATISGANTGTVVGHAMTPGAISAGAVSAADTPAFGFNPAISESFSSSGAGAELLFANNGTPLSSPDMLSPVTVSGLDDIATTVAGNLGDFYGTSAASASLAGVAALILSANPTLTPAQVEQIMEQTALPMANSAVSGAGLVQVDAAVAAAEALLPKVVIESAGSTSLTEFGNNFYFYNSGGSGPSFKFNGSPFFAGEFGAWTLIGAEQVANGYDVALKVAGADQYTIWNTDSNGNYVAAFFGTVSGSSLSLEAFEPIFHQDLNGDGLIGPPTTVIESFGSTILTEVGNNFYLYNSGGSGPSFKFGGSPFTAGEFGAWTLIGAEQVAGGGYDVALKVAGADQYTVWTTDSNGNFVSALTGVVSGGSAALELLEPVFHQDLNHDGLIGPPTTVIESAGSTSLTEIGNNFYFYNSGGSGPSFKFGGTPFTAGEFGAWTLIGAEQVANGYDVALKVAGADQYTIWNTDVNGNYVAAFFGTVSGSNTSLESFESVFHQDLNGDGLIGPPTTVIESAGSTSLVEIGNNFYFYHSGAGPEFQFNGAPFFAGELGSWTLIGAEQIAGGGYDVALKVAGADQYTVWTTDSSGNYVSALFGVVSGSSNALESIESLFHQDLNGDGTIGVPASGGGATLTLVDANSGLTSFTGSTLAFEASSTFTGQIAGFAGDGTSQGSDQIDLLGMNYNSLHSSYNNSTGVLAVTDGTHTVDLQFLGNYSQSNFVFADAGNGGTIVYAQTGSSQPSVPGSGSAAPIEISGGNNSTSAAGQDNFVFAPNFGQVTLAHFTPATDTIQINSTVFANVAAVLAATHDDGHGNAVITDAAHDTITIQNVTTAQLLAHQGDFHIV